MLNSLRVSFWIGAYPNMEFPTGIFMDVTSVGKFIFVRHTSVSFVTLRTFSVTDECEAGCKCNVRGRSTAEIGLKLICGEAYVFFNVLSLFESNV